MGTLHTSCTIKNASHRNRSDAVERMLVDTGRELTWAPHALLEALGIAREKKDLRFQMANGETITQSIGFAIVQVGDSFTIDEGVFGEDGDLPLLGARSLEGMNLTVDAANKKLVAAVPHPAAAV